MNEHAADLNPLHAFPCVSRGPAASPTPATSLHPKGASPKRKKTQPNLLFRGCVANQRMLEPTWQGWGKRELQKGFAHPSGLSELTRPGSAARQPAAAADRCGWTWPSRCLQLRALPAPCQAFPTEERAAHLGWEQCNAVHGGRMSPNPPPPPPRCSPHGCSRAGGVSGHIT